MNTDLRNLMRIEYSRHRPGWRFRAVRGRFKCQQIFRDGDYGGKRGALKAAMRYRDWLLKDLPAPWADNLPSADHGVRLMCKRSKGYESMCYRVVVPASLRASHGFFRDLYLNSFETAEAALIAAKSVRAEMVAEVAKTFTGRGTRSHVVSNQTE